MGEHDDRGEGRARRAHEAKVVAEMRANLRKRKAWVRARRVAGQPEDPTPEAPEER